MPELSQRKRAEFSDSLTSKEINALVADKSLEVLQTSRPVSDKTWQRINAEFVSARPDVEIRIYVFPMIVCDFSFLRLLPNVRRFRADSIRHATGFEHFGELRQIEELTVGVMTLESLEFLNRIPAGALRVLYLLNGHSTKPSLHPVARFSKLKTLRIERFRNDIDALSSLQHIEDLALRSVTMGGLDFLKGYQKLQDFSLQLGGIKDLSSLAGLDRIRFINLWRIRGLKNVSVISKLVGLQYLFMQSLGEITTVPDLTRLTRLRKVHFEGLKSLTRIDALAKAPALEEIVHIGTKGITPSDYQAVIMNPSLKRVAVGFRTKAEQEEFDQMLSKTGVRREYCRDFEFRN